VKVTLVPLLLCLAALSSADRFILSPTGRKIPVRTVRVEQMFDAGDRRNSLTYVGAGITTAVDAEIGWDRLGQSDREVVLNFSYNVVDPLVNLNPGISFGVQDALGRSARGRRYFGAITWRKGLYGDLNSDSSLDVTLGWECGDFNGPVFSVNLPFTNQIRLVAETEGPFVTGGVELRLSKEATVRWLHRDGLVLWTMALTLKY
jgi:hypothetical protein